MKNLVVLFMVVSGITLADGILMGVYGTHFGSERNKSLNNDNDFIGYEFDINETDSILVSRFMNSFFHETYAINYNKRFNPYGKIRPLISAGISYGYEDGQHGKVYINKAGKAEYREINMITIGKFAPLFYVGAEIEIVENFNIEVVTTGYNVMVMAKVRI